MPRKKPSKSGSRCVTSGSGPCCPSCAPPMPTASWTSDVVRGTLLKALMKEPGVTEVVGVDVSSRALDVAARRLHVDTMAPNQRDRLRLLQGSLTYRDRRLSGFDAAVLMEVIEHLEPERLEALEWSVFAEAAPTTVIVTTPNIEYNVRFESLPFGSPPRHRDYRFEWTRAEFRAWADGVAERNRYRIRYLPVGEDDFLGRSADESYLPDEQGTQTSRPPGKAGAERTATRSACPRSPWSCSWAPAARASRRSRRGTSPPPRSSGSDFCRALVSDDDNDQTVTSEAFDVLHHIAGVRLGLGRMTVVDATNVQAHARQPLVELARRHHVLPVAIVLDVPERLCQERNAGRADRTISGRT